MISVTREPIDISDGEQENCVFCNIPTPYWYERNDVPVCKPCAHIVEPIDVPTKKEWIARVEKTDTRLIRVVGKDIH